MNKVSAKSQGRVHEHSSLCHELGAVYIYTCIKCLLSLGRRNACYWIAIRVPFLYEGKMSC